MWRRIVVLAGFVVAATGAAVLFTAGREWVSSAPDGAARASSSPASSSPLVDVCGTTIGTRFAPPPGYVRVAARRGSFAAWLRDFRLEPDGAAVHYYNGHVKKPRAYCAVLDLSVGERDLQQCADTVIRLEAEYHYARGEHSEIAYHFESGFLCDWDTWRSGNRVQVDGDAVTWVGTGSLDSSRGSFREYLDTVFAYASTRSLIAHELTAVPLHQMRIGDVFIHRGHVVLVADMARQPSTGKTCFLLVQGANPAQQAQVLRDRGDPDVSPWYMVPADSTGMLVTPENHFRWTQLMRFIH